MEPWDPSQVLQGVSPDLWLRADQGVYTGGARQFYSADKTSATLASFAAVNLSTTDFSLVSSVYRDTTGNQVIAAKYQDASNYWRWEITAGHKLHFIAVIGGVTLIEVTGATSLSTTATWYRAAVVVDRDAAGTTEIYLNGVNDTSGTPTVSASTIDNTGAFWLAQSGADTLYWNGRLADIGVFKNDLLTQTEITWDYNGGGARVYGELGVVGTDGASLVPSWWANCNESSGTASIVDQASTNDLTPTFAELLSNTGFETAGGGGADVFGSWDEAVNGTGTITDEGTIVDAGSHSAKLVSGSPAASNVARILQSVVVSGHRYSYTLRARGGAGSEQIRIYMGINVVNAIHVMTTSYATYSGTLTSDGTAFGIYNHITNSATIYLDTVSVKAVDIPAANGPSSDVLADTGSVGTNHGTLTNFASSATAYSTDVPSAIGSGFSLSFDGVDDRVVITPSPNLGSQYTIAAWVSKQTTGLQAIMADRPGADLPNQFALEVETGAGLVRFRLQGGVYQSASAISLSTWTHLAVVVDSTGNTVKIFINGALSGGTQAMAENPAYNSATDMTIGSQRVFDFWNGKIDDVQLYTAALSDSQVTEIYTNGDVPAAATPVHRWTFDDGPPSTLVDGDPVCSWESLEGNRYQFLQAIASQRPYWRASVINSKPGLEFDSLDDLLTCVNGAVLTGGAFTTIAIWRQKEVPNSYQTLVATSDTAGATKYFALHARGNTANPHIGYEQRNADTADLLDGDTEVTDELDCAGYWSSSGTAISARLNGTAQTLAVDAGANNGDGPGNAETADKDVTTIGGLKHTSETNFAGVILCDLIHYPVELTAASRAIVAAYVLREYGLVL